MEVSAIIPAYNEEKTIGSIIRELKKVNYIKEIIVVSDGSIDNTAKVAEAAGAKVIELATNLGKGAAMIEGLKKSEFDLLLFLDADLIGLNTEHILKLIHPVLLDEADMTVGLFENGRAVTDLAQFVAPYLSGQRAVKKFILEQMTEIESVGFGIEVALTKYVHKNKFRVKEIYLEDLTHVMKEEKLGLVKGVKARLKMYWEIAKSVSYSSK